MQVVRSVSFFRKDVTMLQVKNAHVYTPKDQGIQDV